MASAAAPPAHVAVVENAHVVVMRVAGRIDKFSSTVRRPLLDVVEDRRAAFAMIVDLRCMHLATSIKHIKKIMQLMKVLRPVVDEWCVASVIITANSTLSAFVNKLLLAFPETRMPRRVCTTTVGATLRWVDRTLVSGADATSATRTIGSAVVALLDAARDDHVDWCALVKGGGTTEAPPEGKCEVEEEPKGGEPEVEAPEVPNVNAEEPKVPSVEAEEPEVLSSVEPEADDHEATS